MKKSYFVTPLVAGALILPAALPATAAQASAPAPAAVSTVNKTALTTDQIKAERSALNSRINMLQETQKAIPGSQYADQIEDLIKTALDLSGAIDTIAHGGVHRAGERRPGQFRGRPVQRTGAKLRAGDDPVLLCEQQRARMSPARGRRAGRAGGVRASDEHVADVDGAPAAVVV